MTMDTLKSYFHRMIPHTANMRKGSGKWRRGRTRDRDRGLLPHRSASTSHVDLTPRDSDMDSNSLNSNHTFTPALDSLPRHLQLHRVSEPPTTLSKSSTLSKKKSRPQTPVDFPPPLQGQDAISYGTDTSSIGSGSHGYHGHDLVDQYHQSRHDGMRTPPPSKPPRKDLVFSIQLDTEGLNDIGIDIDCFRAAPSPSASSYSSRSSTRRKPVPVIQLINGGAEAEGSDSQSQSSCSTPKSMRGQGQGQTGGDDVSVKDKPPSVSSFPSGGQGGAGLTCKVVSLTKGSRCNLDGRVKVNDEIVDINGESLHKESRESAK